MNRKGMALTQSILLILGIVAIAFMIGSEVQVVSANDISSSCKEITSQSESCSVGDKAYMKSGNNYVIFSCKDQNSKGAQYYSEGNCDSVPTGSNCACQDGANYLYQGCTLGTQAGTCILASSSNVASCSEKGTEPECGGTTSGYVCCVQNGDQKSAASSEEGATGSNDGANPPQANTATENSKDTPATVKEETKGDSTKAAGIVSGAVATATGAVKQEITSEGVGKVKEMLKDERAKVKKLLGLGDKATDAEKQELLNSQANVKSLEDSLQLANEAQATAEKDLSALSGTTSFLGKFAKGFFQKLPMKKEGADVLKQAAIDAKTKALQAAGEDVTTEASKEAIQKAGESAAKTTTSTLGYAAYAAAWAVAGVTISKLAVKAIGASERNQRMLETGSWVAAGATAVAATYIASATTLFTTTVATSAGTITLAAGPPGWMVAGAVVVLTAIWGAFNYQDYSQEIFTYQSNLWQPVKGGEDCQACNSNPYGCSEYQCHSYGAACVLLNPGTQYESCDWNNSRDFNPPQIAQLDILDANYEYTPMKDIQLPDRGVQIIYTGKDASEKQCIPAFTGVKFGVKTDEPAQCKIDLERKYSYDDMISYMTEGTVYTYNHTIAIPSSAYPSEYALNESGWSIDTGKDQDFFIRCEDANGNLNPMHFVVSFCVDDGPDTTAPEIETNYLTSAYVTSGTQYVDDLEVYTNEPATCKWDFIDRDYDSMEYDMTGCSKSLGEYTFPESYKYGCFGNLTGIKDGQNNNYYIRCKDKPNLNEETAKERRVANEQSYKLTLIGTNPLAIDAIAVNNETLYQENMEDKDYKIVDSTTPVKATLTVKTSQGAEKNGNARCAYSLSNNPLYYEFYNNGIFDYLFENTHDLYLNDGTYNYNIRCCDLANNCDTEPISFKVETDTTAPEISRAYYEDNMLKLTTTETAECVYSTSTCNYLFEDGLPLETNDNLNHYLDWDTTTDLHIKCKDKFGNLPAAKSCQMTVRAYDEYTPSKE